MTRPSRFIRTSISVALLLICLGCPGGGVGPGPLASFTGKLDPITLTLKPGASADFQLTGRNSTGELVFNTADVVWTIEGGPTFSVGTVVNAPGQMPQAKTVVGHFQSVASLPVGTNQVTFRIKTDYSASTSNHVEAFATVTLDVNAPPSASEEKTP